MSTFSARAVQIDGLDRPLCPLVLGTDWFRPEQAERIEPLLEAYLAAGGNAVDSAQVYGSGQSERVLGDWLGRRRNRDELILITKGAHPSRDRPQRVCPACIDADLAASLERLGTDHVDIYLLHRDDETVPVGPIVECLHRHQEAGRVRAFGGSNWTHRRIQEANDYAASHGLSGFAISSPNLCLAQPNEPMWRGCVWADEPTRRWHERTRLPLLSWSSQGRGFFSGRFRPEDAELDKDVARVYYSVANWARLARCRELAAAKGVSAIQIALAWVLNQPFPVAAVVGPQTAAEVASCFAAGRISLTAAERAWLESGQS